MVNIESLKRQHEEIGEIINNIRNLVAEGRLEAKANELAIMINTLAGKLKIHLSTEDKFMYPELLNSQSEEVRNTARAYIDEMGTISETFMAYKERFNTRSKISASPDSFASESDRVFSVIEKRIDREESHYINFYRDK